MTVFLCGFGGRFVMSPTGLLGCFPTGFFGGRTQFAHTLSHLMSKNNVCLSICVYEHFLLMCKRKRSQKKSTRAVPARHPTALPQHQPSLPQEAARHMRPQTRFRSDSAGLCGRLCRPSPRNNRFALFVAAKLVRVSSSISVLQMCAVG